MDLNFSISRLVLIASIVSVDARKQLNQRDRRLLTVACETLKNPDHIDFFYQKEKRLKKLIKNLSLNKSQIVFQTPYSILKKVFKALANFFNFRISSMEVESKLKDAFENSIPKNGCFATYIELLSTIAQKRAEFEIPAQKFLHISKTIQSFYFLSTQKNSFINEKINLPVDLLKKAGFSLAMFNDETIAQLIKGPEMLQQKYQEAKKDDLSLRKFFTDAFDPNDKNVFDAVYDRILNFNLLLKAIDHDKEQKPLIEEILPPIVVEAPKPIKMLDLPPIPGIDKKKTRFLNVSHLSDIFKDRQAQKYAYDHDWETQEIWVKESAKIYQLQDFTDNYYNQSTFEKFLKEEVEIVGEETSEGLFLEGQIEFYAQKIFNLDQVVHYQAWRER